MEELIKITAKNCPALFNQNIDKYLLVNSKKNIVGIASINDKLNYNKINIDVLQEYRGNGYGKFMFSEIVKEYKKNYNSNRLEFRINSNSLINNILYKSGAINIANNDGITVFVLPVK